MKTLLAAIIFVVSFISLGIGMLNQYLILQKLEATQLMWFLYWFNIPMLFILSILNEALKRLKDEF